MNERELKLAELKEFHPDLSGFEPGTKGFHELLDRASLIQTMWEDYVRNHPSCVLNKELFLLADSISNEMANFYVNVGNKSFTEK